MTTFLFWNVHRRVSAEAIAKLAWQHEVDVLILAECSLHPATLLLALNVERTEFDYAPSPGCDKIQIFTRFPPDFLLPLEETPRLTIRRLALPGLSEILLAAVHLLDKGSVSEESQKFELSRLSRLIRQVEAREGNDRTVLLGDFNVNPFESGMVATDGLHAVMTRRIAASEARTVQSESFPFFYNPMWGFFGDHSTGPPGTYHYRAAESVCYFWNIFDQVLLRPSLLGMFKNENLQILTGDLEVPLLSKRKGTPRLSDHLPILFKLSL